MPDFRLNKAFDKLNTLSQAEKDKVEFLCNECCWFGAGTEKPAMKRSAVKIWVKTVRSITARHRTGRGAIFFQKLWRIQGLLESMISGISICQWDFQFKNRGQRTRQCPDTGISALLHDQTGIPDTCQRKNLSGQYAGSVLENYTTALC